MLNLILIDVQYSNIQKSSLAKYLIPLSPTPYIYVENPDMW